MNLSNPLLRSASMLLLLQGVSGFRPLVHSPLLRTKPLYGIRCENKYYQLEEMEDKENSTTELFLKEDGNIVIGQTDGPLWAEASGNWVVKPGTDEFSMTIHKKFDTGSKGRDMGEFAFTVSRTYEGDMTLVGESVAITGVMKNGVVGETQDVGFFNMIDGTDIRLDARSDARPGGEKKDPTKVSKKNDATSTHKGAEGFVVGQSPLPFGWEEHWDQGQQRHYYVETTTGTTQWEKPQQQSLQSMNTQSSSDALPQGWQEHFDPAQQKNYYVNTATGASQWEKPQQQTFGQQPASGGGGGALPQGWEEHFDPAQQKNYYVNTATGASQWERPQ